MGISILKTIFTLLRIKKNLVADEYSLTTKLSGVTYLGVVRRRYVRIQMD